MGQIVDYSQFILQIEKAIANGVASLDSNAKVPKNQISLNASDVGAIAVEADPTVSIFTKGLTTNDSILTALNASSGLISSDRLPSYVDDVLSYAAIVNFPVAGETSKIYVTEDTNKIYRWSGSSYVEISSAATADTALKLSTPRTISTTGDATYSVSFDGSANVSSAITLATVNSNVGAFGGASSIPAITVNAKGQVTAVSTNSIGNELIAIQSLSDTPGFLKKTGDGTYSIDINSYLSLAGGTLTGDLISTSATVSTSPTTGAICGASLGISGAIFAGTLNGNGSGLTTLNASNLSSGTIPDARLTGAYTGITNLTGSGTATFGAFSGSGASLTALNASNISTGTINAARLPASYLPLTGGTVKGTLTVAAEALTGYYSQVVQSGNNLDIIANGDQAFRVSLGTNNGTGNIRFFTAGWTTGDTERMQITATGNVGIGLVNPSTKLQVAGTITTTDMIVSAATPSTSPTTGASRVTGGQGIGGNQYVGGFTSLGGNASHPGIKIKVLTGTTAATEGGVSRIAHGLTVSKIVSVTVLVNQSENAFVLSGYSTQFVGHHFSVSADDTDIIIINHPTDSENILLKPVKITVIYTA